MNLYSKILTSQKRVGNLIRATPLEYSIYLSRLCDCNVYLKLESEQLTGSFKIRGALNKILSLSKKQRKKGVVAYSTGNHALAVGYAAKMLKMKAIIYAPFNADKSKLEMIKQYPVQIKTFNKSSEETEITKHARKFASASGMAFVSPYNDPLVIAGQGTIGYEIYEQLPKIDAAFVCVGGGGLISGIGAYLKAENKNIKIVGCLPKSSPSMYESVKAGRIVDVKIRDTLSDGSAGNNEHDTITFGLCKKYADDWILVSENEIADAIRLVLDKHRKLIEGAAAVPVAALIRQKNRLKNKNVVVVLCGSNISLDKLRKVLCNK